MAIIIPDIQCTEFLLFYFYLSSPSPAPKAANLLPISPEELPPHHLTDKHLKEVFCLIYIFFVLENVNFLEITPLTSPLPLLWPEILSLRTLIWYTGPKSSNMTCNRISKHQVGPLKMATLTDPTFSSASSIVLGT